MGEAANRSRNERGGALAFAGYGEGRPDRRGIAEILHQPASALTIAFRALLSRRPYICGYTNGRGDNREDRRTFFDRLLVGGLARRRRPHRIAG